MLKTTICNKKVDRRNNLQNCIQKMILNYTLQNLHTKNPQRKLEHLQKLIHDEVLQRKDKKCQQFQIK